MREALGRVGRVARWVGPPALLLVLMARFDLRGVGRHLATLDLRFVAAFLALSVVFYVLCAWRWTLIAARLGATLPLRRAVLDYYLSTLLNQVLPVGVGGDVVRAARHRRRLDARWGPPVLAIALERLSGVLGLSLVVVVSSLVWLAGGERRFAVALAVVAVAFAITLALLAARPSRFPRLAAILADARRAFVGGGALAAQLVASVGAAAVLLVMFACAARAVGVPLDAPATLRVVPFVLAVTTIPWAFAGWGARELSVAALFGLAGLDPAAGVAASVTFGALSLVAAAPGLVVLWLPQKGPA